MTNPASRVKIRALEQKLKEKEDEIKRLRRTSRSASNVRDLEDKLRKKSEEMEVWKERAKTTKQKLKLVESKLSKYEKSTPKTNGTKSPTPGSDEGWLID